MIALLIGIFLVILFIVTIVLSVSTWRAWHIVVACLTFLAAVGLVVVASLSQKTHNYWRKTHATVSQQLDDAKHEGIVLEHGDPTLVASPTPSVDDLQHRLNRSLMDRGRVWRRCTPGVPANNAIVISTVPPTATGEPGDPNTAKPNGIAAKMVLYAFLEDANQMPIAYLGEFQVSDAQPAAVTLQPTMPLDGQQQALVAAQPARWTLYEMMPIDSHRAFSDEDTVGKTLDDTKQPVFGPMNEQNLRGVFATVTGQPADSPLVTELVAAYVKDGSSVTAAEEGQFPDNIWKKLEFKKDHKERVDSNNPDSGMSGNYFDPEGYAEVSRLRRGDEAAVRNGDIGLFPFMNDEDKRLVTGLTSSGICDDLGPYYARSLRDYEEGFHDSLDRFNQCMEATRRAQRDVDALKSTIVKTQEQTAYRQEEHSKLQQDAEGYTRDGAKLAELVAALESQKKSLREELSGLFQTNLALDQQLTEYNAKLTEEINRRAADVAAIQTP
jgi:hypothetical protein